MGSGQLPLHELLRLCLQSKDETLWFEFVTRTQPRLAAVVSRRLGHSIKATPSLIEDLVQDTYLKLSANNFRTLRNFECDHEAALFGYLKVAASHVADDYLRSFFSVSRGGGKQAEDLEKAEAAPVNDRSGREAELGILMQEVGRYLEKNVSLRDCQIFWLYYKYGLTAQAISKLPQIGLTVDGVESALLRMSSLLRSWLGGNAGKKASSG